MPPTGSRRRPEGGTGRVQAVWADVWFAARVLLLAGATVALATAYGAGLRWLPVWAILRAGLQLSVVALLLRGVLTVPGTAAAFVLLMLTTASLTSMGRTRELWRGRTAAVLGVVAGSLVSLGAIFALHLAALDARYVVAIGGIVIGNTMTRRDPVGPQLPPGLQGARTRGRGLALPRRHAHDRPPRLGPRGRARVAHPQPRPDEVDRPRHPSGRVRRGALRRRRPGGGREVPAHRARRHRARHGHDRDRGDGRGPPFAVRAREHDRNGSEHSDHGAAGDCHWPARRSRHDDDLTDRPHAGCSTRCRKSPCTSGSSRSSARPSARASPTTSTRRSASG